MVTPIWKQQFANGKHPIKGLCRIFFERFVLKFLFLHKSSKWGRKCIFMDHASRNRSPFSKMIFLFLFCQYRQHFISLRVFFALIVLLVILVLSVLSVLLLFLVLLGLLVSTFIAFSNFSAFRTFSACSKFSVFSVLSNSSAFLTSQHF